MDGNGVPRALAGPRLAPSRRRIPVIETPSPATSRPDPLHPLDFQHQADEVSLALNLALTPVDGLLTDHCTATDARARHINAASAAERSNGRGASRSPGQIETCLVGLRRSLARAVAALQSYLLESQQAHDECVGLNRIAHLAPVDKSTLCVADYAENLNPCELSPHIVVGFVPVLLEIDENRRYAATLAGPEHLGLRVAFAEWLRRSWAEEHSVLADLDDKSRRELDRMVAEGEVEAMGSLAVERWREQKAQIHARGRTQGRMEGRTEGIEHYRHSLARQASRRFGASAGERLSALLAGISEPEQLAAVGDAIIDCETGAELLTAARRIAGVN